jgi:hypothetical protein
MFTASVLRSDFFMRLNVNECKAWRKDYFRYLLSVGRRGAYLRPRGAYLSEGLYCLVNGTVTLEYLQVKR